MISPHDFEQFQEDELSKEFSKMRFQPQRNGSQFPHQYGQMEFMRAQQNQMYRRDNSQWANEFHKSMQDNREFEDFERVYNSKSRQPQHRVYIEILLVLALTCCKAPVLRINRDGKMNLWMTNG